MSASGSSDFGSDEDEITTGILDTVIASSITKATSRSMSGAVMLLAMQHLLSELNESCDDSVKTGQMWVTEVLNGHWKRSVEGFRMRSSVFWQLCELLETQYGFKPTRGVSTEEAVGIFLYTLGHKVGSDELQERFQHSWDTIRGQFHNVLKAASRMTADWTTSSFNDNPHHHLRNNRLYWPAFKDCVGVMDGTCVQIRNGEYQNSYVTQKLLAVCDFDMCFTYISTGWEGIMHDCQIMHNAICDQKKRFLIPPAGKYYLVKEGYPNTRGFLAPYSRDHLSQFMQGDTMREAKEVFDHRHASLHSVIDRAFGVWKARWPIIESMPPFSVDHQMAIIGVTMALHNFVRRNDRDDAWFRFAERYGARHRELSQANSSSDVATMAHLRDQITSVLANNNVIS